MRLTKEVLKEHSLPKFLVAKALVNFAATNSDLAKQSRQY